MSYDETIEEAKRNAEHFPSGKDATGRERIEVNGQNTAVIKRKVWKPIAKKSVAKAQKKYVLVGTYKKGQLERWPGYYNYPLYGKDKIDLANAKKVNELWLFSGVKEGRYFSAECLGEKTREELKEFGYKATGKGHGSGKYLLFKIKKLYKPSTDFAEAVIIRTKDFAGQRKSSLQKKLKSYLESPDRKDPILAKMLPKIVIDIPRERLRVCEAAVQLLFFSKLVPVDNCSGSIVPFPSPPKSKFTFIDLFAGVGGIRLGFQAAGGRCVFSSEWNKAAAETYERNFAEAPYGDIQKIDARTIPDHDVLCAGFPCQPFSISGKQRGFEDTRGTMFFEVCRIIKVKEPHVVFLENVKHLVHHNHGNTLQVILQSLKDLGYTVNWRVLNGSDFGVAQNRERIIIVGIRKGIKFDFETLKKSPKVLLKDVLDKEGHFEFLNPRDYTLLENPKLQPESGLMFAGYRNKTIRVAGVRPGTLHLSRVHKQPNRIYSVFGVHPTLPSQESSGRYFIRLPDDRVRKLTLHECWRIMGFPESYIKVSTPGDQYRQLGNSVCVPMITAVANEIAKKYFGG